MTADSPVTDLLRILERLCGVLDREIELLRAPTPSRLVALQTDKAALTAAYEARVKEIRATPGLLDAATPQVRAELRAATERFERALRANERGVRAAKEVTERVLRAIAEEMDKKRREATGYSGRGAEVSARAVAGLEPISIAFNRTV